MAFFESVISQEERLVIGLFGVQTHHPDASSFLATLRSLLLPPPCPQAAAGPRCVEQLVSRPVSPSSSEKVAARLEPAATVLYAVFTTAEDYARWWGSAAVRQFWDHGLPEADAGVWREIMHLHTRRLQTGSSTARPKGIGRLFPPAPSQRAGYWGSYRSRIPESARGNKFGARVSSDAVACACGRKRSSSSSSSSSSSRGTKMAALPTTSIIPGRVLVRNAAHDNLCWIHEGQDYRGIDGAEKAAHRDTGLRQTADRWIAHLEKEQRGDPSCPCRHGVFFVRSLAAAAVADDDDDEDEDLHQIAVFADLGCVERAARTTPEHLRLRSQLRELYGPGGPLVGGRAKSTFWVEMGILEQGVGLDAEYVGCVEGTGIQPYATLLNGR